jgi:hypothetical protein
MNTSQVFMSLETKTIQSLSNKQIKQIANAQINLPSNFYANITYNLPISIRVCYFFYFLNNFYFSIVNDESTCFIW